MAIREVAINEGDVVFFGSQNSVVNFGTVVSVEFEVFVRVQDNDTGDVIVLKPEAVMTKEDMDKRLKTIEDTAQLKFTTNAAGEKV